MEFTNNSTTTNTADEFVNVTPSDAEHNHENTEHGEEAFRDVDPNNGNEDEEGPQSSLENIIPLANLKRGWFAVSGYVMEKANEAYNSESFQHIKQKTTEVVEKTSEVVKPALEKTAEVIKPAWEKTTEVVKPAWEKTVEVAAPIWEQTKATTYVAVEKTRENINIATENMKPVMQSVSQLHPIKFFRTCYNF